MGAYVIIVCVALLSSIYGLTPKKRIGNLELQFNVLSLQTKEDIMELRYMIESINSTCTTADDGDLSPRNNGVKSEELQVILEKVDNFIDEQNERNAVLQKAFVNEKIRNTECMNEKKDTEQQNNDMYEKVKDSIKKLANRIDMTDDRIDMAELERNMTSVDIMGVINEHTAVLKEINAKLEKLEQTGIQPTSTPGTTVKPKRTTLKPAGPPCPESWLHHGDKCYQYVAGFGMTWEEARRHCYDNDAILAEPDTEEAMSYVISLVAFKGNGYAWIGGTDEQGTWIWAHSKKPVTYFKWKSGHPTNTHGVQHCMEIYGGYISDDTCNYKEYHVCQKNVN